MRIDAKTIERLDKASRREGMSRSQMAKTLIEEGLRMQAHPGIVFRPGPTGRRAGLARGPDVWEMMNSFKDRSHVSDKEVEYWAKALELSTHEVRTALRYYSEYTDEIEERIRLNDEAAERGYSEWLARQGASSR